jgi:hypothetical protein
MSEYQSYEFLALDHPLTAKQMEELRAISTRAKITPTRFWNEYQWGDLKANPEKLLERYFDAHLYLANWGTHRLLLRIPAASVDQKNLRTYFRGDAAHVRIAGEHVIFNLCSEDEERDFEESRGSLAAIAPVRTELMRGDLRVAYLAWLLTVQAGDVPEEDVEPPAPAGLAALTKPQAKMVEFLRIDEDLISAAADGSDQPSEALGGERRRAFRAEGTPARAAGHRTVAELLAAAERHREQRERAEAQRAERSKKAAQAKRNKHLDALAKRADAAWTELEALVEKSDYEKAMKLATDLRDLAKRDGASVPFEAPFEAMRKRQLRRRGFFDRWKRQNEPKRR